MITNDDVKVRYVHYITIPIRRVSEFIKQGYVVWNSHEDVSCCSCMDEIEPGIHKAGTCCMEHEDVICCSRMDEMRIYPVAHVWTR